MTGGPVEVARFHWRHEAEMALGILEDEGIPGVVRAHLFFKAVEPVPPDELARACG